MGGRGSGSGMGGYNRDIGGEYSTLAEAERGMGYGNGGAADKWIEGLSKAEVDSFDRYGSGGWYYDFNKTLREAERFSQKEMHLMSNTQLKVLKNMDKALDRSVLENPMTVTRATSGLEFDLPRGTLEEKARAIAQRKGEVMVNHGFMSTTAKGGGTSWQTESGNNVIYHIKTPAGKGIGGYIGGVLKTDYHRNDVTEFLFNRGSAIEINGAYVKNGKIHVNATYVGRQKSSAKFVGQKEYFAWQLSQR